MNVLFAAHCLRQCQVVLERIDAAYKSGNDKELHSNFDDDQNRFKLIPNNCTVRTHVLWLPRSSRSQKQVGAKCDESQEQSLIDGASQAIESMSTIPDESNHTQDEHNMSQNQSISQDSQASVSMQMYIQVKEENEKLKNALKVCNLRLGDQTIANSSTSSVEDEVDDGNPVNTRNYQIDSLFAPKYYYITNVR